MDKMKLPDNADPRSPLRPPVSEKDFATFGGGVKRSKAMPPWNMLQWKALRGVLRRFQIGLKYGYANWKMALDVPREKWHEGEPGALLHSPGSGECSNAADESTLGTVRQFAAHMFEHWANVMALVDLPAGAVSEKGDGLRDNMDAFVWNALCLLEYLIENEDLFRESFSQYPSGHAFHRLDLPKKT